MRFLSHFFRGLRALQPAATPLPRSHAFPLLAAAVLLSFCGCGGGSASPQSVTPSTYVISGTITPASDGSGATLTLSGPATASTTADSFGNYSFSGLANGTYVVTPTRSGYSFSPTQQTVTVKDANATGINFTSAEQTSYSVGLSWQPSASPVSGYNVYRGTTDGGPYTKINSSLITTLSYTDTSVAGGNTYYYVSTSVNSAGVESVYSNQATAQIP